MNDDINVEDLKDFVINEEKPKIEDYETITMESVIDNFDFSSKDEFNIDEAYEYIEFSNMPKETKEVIEKKEADNVIEKLSPLYLDSEYANKIINQYNNIRSLIRRYDVNSDLVKNMDENQKDKIYGIAQYLFSIFQKDLNDMSFSFEIDKDEWKFLYNLYRNKLEYDQNKIFQLKDVYDKYLKNVEETAKTLKNVSLPTIISVNVLIMLYHLISEYKVKGMGDEYYAFRNILTKIGERIRLFNAYNVWSKRLNDEVVFWAGMITPESTDIPVNEDDNVKMGNVV